MSKENITEKTFLNHIIFTNDVLIDKDYLYFISVLLENSDELFGDLKINKKATKKYEIQIYFNYFFREDEGEFEIIFFEKKDFSKQKRRFLSVSEEMLNEIRKPFKEHLLKLQKEGRINANESKTED